MWFGNDSNDELLEMSLGYDNAVDNVRLDNDIKWLVWFGLDAICANVHKSVRDVNGVKLPYIFLIPCNRWNETKYERVENGRKYDEHSSDYPNGGNIESKNHRIKNQKSKGNDKIVSKKGIHFGNSLVNFGLHKIN